MAEKDIAAGIYFENPVRFADLINAYFFEGEEVVQPEDIQELDTVEYAPAADRRRGTNKKGYRDLVRRLYFGVQFVIFSMEIQNGCDYSMPIRVFNYDGSRYGKQLRKKRRKHREKKDLKGNEFLSGIAKTDRFCPVVTLILCFGKWDGARSLHQLMDMEGIPEKLRKSIVDYPLDILEAAEFEHLEYFQTDLKLVFGFIKYAQDKERLRYFIKKNRVEFENLAEDAYDLISVMSNTQELKRRKKEDEGGLNMCKAIDDMMTEAREEGRQEALTGLQGMVEDAREEGRQEALTGLQGMMEDAREEERRNVIRIFVKDYQKSGCSREVISRKLETLFSLPPEAAENYLG